MKYWLLGIGCAVYALAMLVLFHVAPGMLRYGIVVCYAVVGVASLVTAASYAARDRLRWAWAAIGAGYLIAFCMKMFIGDNAAIPTFSTERAIIFVVAVFLLNAGLLTGLVLFARVWSGTGLAPSWRGQATLIFLVLAIAVNIPGINVHGRAILNGRIASIGVFTSILGDIASIALVGPIFATAIALRGGILMRPWLFLFFATIAWLADDCTAPLPREVGQSIDVVVRTLAILLSGAAAVAQLWVKREVRSTLDEA